MSNIELQQPAIDDVATIEGYASIFHTPDLKRDVILPGAFDTALARAGAIKMLFQHDPAQPIGRWIELRATQKGLFVKGEILVGSTRGREIYTLLRGGALRGLSIGFRPKTTRRRRPTGREISRLDLWEISIVTFPMAPKAQLTKIGDVRPSICQRAASPTRAAKRAPSHSPGGARHFAKILRQATRTLLV